jgi:archaetidylinositol phosphate synthase
MHVWRERLSRWFTPLARTCPLSPNAVSIIALALNLLASLLFLGGRTRPYLFLVAVVFVIAGGLADAFDGIVARVQQKESVYGDFLDHVADRISDTALAACWMIGNDVAEWLVVIAISLVMLNGYIGTQIEATFRERSYDSVGRGEFVLALIIFPIVSFILCTSGWNALRFGGLTIPDDLTLALVAFALIAIVQRFAIAKRLS